MGLLDMSGGEFVAQNTAKIPPPSFNIHTLNEGDFLHSLFL